MSDREQTKELANNFSIDKLTQLLRLKSRAFRPREKDLSEFTTDRFVDVKKVGEIPFENDADQVVTIAINTQDKLTHRSSKNAQFKIAKKILKDLHKYDGGVFAFFDDAGNFRFSFVYATFKGERREFNKYKRSTFYVSPKLPNKTFIQQVGDGDFSSLETVKEVFSISAVTEAFYKEFLPHFENISEAIRENTSEDVSKGTADDFALLFVIRIIFLGFIQKRGWLGGNQEFIQDFWGEYKVNHFQENLFYANWLEELFFNALNSSPENKEIEIDAPENILDTLQSAPFLNGGLFQKRDIDRNNYSIPDEVIDEFFEFIFSYNFTAEENELYDEELELNPEFLGIIFERLINKEFGAIYTPRTEVDYMCRLSLVKWLENKTSNDVRIENLYELVFPEKGIDKDQKRGSFSDREKEHILELLESITVCDPAAGSGAFLVGMLQVIEDVETWLRKELGEEKQLSIYEQKKRIIARSLYGVEVQEWAVWIAQLRLWITLFIDAPEELQDSKDPILPSLDFKIKQGDSLVQMMGDTLFSVTDFPDLRKGLKTRVRELQEEKIDYFHNEDGEAWKIREREYGLFKDILKEEIKEKEKKLEQLKQGNGQKQLFETEKEPEQKELDFIEEKKDELEHEIATLREQKENLREDRPFVWSIEFSEIFAAEGGFDVVIGNPPYLRQEDIEDPQGKVSSSKYKDLLQKMVKTDFSRHFKGEHISRRSDLYAYFYIRALHLLNKQGISTYICSNAWLDVEYGKWLQKFLLQKVPVHFIIDNQAKRSFKEAEINTVITVMGKPDGRLGKNRKFKFVAFKKRFEEAVFSKNLIEIEKTSMRSFRSDFRVVSPNVEDLINEGVQDNKYQAKKWGSKYLVSPDFLFQLLNRKESSIVRFPNVYSHTQRNTLEVFNDHSKTREKDGTLPYLSSVKDIKSIHINPEELEYRVAYESKKSAPLCPDVISNRFVSDRLFLIEGGEFVVSDTFFVIKLQNSEDKELVLSLLNSTLGLLFLEVFGRRNLGGGLLAVYGYELRELPILNPDSFSGKARSKIIELYGQLSQRKIKNIFDECDIKAKSNTPIPEQEPDPLPDRKELDDIIFDELDLTEEERKEIYRAVCQLVWNRINKAKSV